MKSDTWALTTSTTGGSKSKLTTPPKDCLRYILVVDDEDYMLSLLKEIVQVLGYCAVTAMNGDQALEKLASHAVDMVITDMNMPGMSGLELMSQVRRTRPHLPVVLISGYGVEHAALAALKHKADGFIGKPFRVEDLRACIEKNLK
jgi:CheY-like chemotaxis protein